jgi:hypothetical protein
MVPGLVARVLRPLLPIHDVSTAYSGAHLPQFLEDCRPGGYARRKRSCIGNGLRGAVQLPQ